MNHHCQCFCRLLLTLPSNTISCSPKLFNTLISLRRPISFDQRPLTCWDSIHSDRNRPCIKQTFTKLIISLFLKQFFISTVIINWVQTKFWKVSVLTLFQNICNVSLLWGIEDFLYVGKQSWKHELSNTVIKIKRLKIISNVTKIVSILANL